VYHCHILDHEDNDMMRPMEVLPALALPDLAPGELYLGSDAVQREFLVQIGTQPGALYEIQTTANLVDWAPMVRVIGSGAPRYVVDPMPRSASDTMRAYRAMVPAPTPAP
jgi:hypothetical protein